MKYLLFILITGLLSHPVMAQVAAENKGIKNTVAYPVSISAGKTSSIVFPFDIISVDRGRKDILVQKAKGVNNILLLKAGTSLFPETNLTVITADGRLYPFVIHYNANPDSLHLHIEAPVDDFKKAGAVAEMHAHLDRIQVETKRNSWLKASRYGITLSLYGLYVKNDIMYLQFRLRNCSNIDFTTASFSISIKDKKQSRRTARQEVFIEPLAHQGDYRVIKGKAAKTITLAVPKFTIPDRKKCLIRIMEDNGGRHITLRVNNNRIIKARPVF